MSFQLVLKIKLKAYNLSNPKSGALRGLYHRRYEIGERQEAAVLVFSCLMFQSKTRRCDHRVSCECTVIINMNCQKHSVGVGKLRGRLLVHQCGPGAGFRLGFGSKARKSWRRVLKMMHKYFVYWDFRQHYQLLMHKNTLQHLQVGAWAPLAHACRRPRAHVSWRYCVVSTSQHVISQVFSISSIYNTFGGAGAR